jgi:transcriptional regulator with XRE-family HTH domain
LSRRYPRLEQAGTLAAVQGRLAQGQSQRAVAEALGVARSTLQDWLGQAPSDEVPAALAQFYASEEGVLWLHRQVLAAHLVITLLAGAGIRQVCTFLELSGLSAFVASSYGSQQKLNAALEAAVVAYAEQQRDTLAAQMPQRRIGVCEDETYHPEICLVAIEPVSNFILRECYAPDRSAATWTRALEEALEGLRVEVVQGTGDEAKGLLRHVERDLGAHHSPDLFHVQREVSKATALPLARALEQAERTADQARAEVAAQRAARDAHQRAWPRLRGRPPAFAARIHEALMVQAHAEAQREQAEAHQQQARACVRELADAYHPYDLDSARAQPPERLGERLAACWQRLGELADAIDLPERARERIAKAERLTTQLLATLTFFFATIQAKVEALGLAPELETLVHQQLIPAIYLERVAARSTRAERRHELHLRSAQLLAPLRQSDSPLQHVDAERRREIEIVAAECADLFQRSSSCVEGRNGQLALHHHGKHRLSNRKLAVLTAVHNYFIRRPDGTTAAERFFGQPPAPMFAYLLTAIDPPPRPARKRPPPSRVAYLEPMAA